jgi:hypothetical protein
MKKALLSLAVVGFLALPAFAQQPLTLEIKDGLVNLDATSVPVRQILAEWARVGGTKVVGAERIAGGPLTLKLVNTPERKALDILLKSVSGYMAAPRLASATPGASAYDRIMILPTPPMPASNNPPARAAGSSPFTPPNRSPRPPGLENTEENQAQADAVEMDNSANNQAPVFTFPQPQVPGQMPPNAVFAPVPPQNVFNPNAFGAPGGFGAPQQPITLQPNANGQPTIYNFVPPNATTPPANGGFTVVGAPTPGMVQQPVQVPGQPVQVRPPGSR